VSGTVYGIEGLKEDHGLRIAEIRVLMRMFAPKRNEIIGGWR
jgi:hypothetical protein